MPLFRTLDVVLSISMLSWKSWNVDRLTALGYMPVCLMTKQSPPSVIGARNRLPVWDIDALVSCRQNPHRLPIRQYPTRLLLPPRCFLWISALLPLFGSIYYLRRSLDPSFVLSFPSFSLPQFRGWGFMRRFSSLRISPVLNPGRRPPLSVPSGAPLLFSRSSSLFSPTSSRSTPRTLPRASPLSQFSKRHCSYRRMCMSRHGDVAGSTNVSHGREVLPTNVKPVHYDLTLEPNFEKFTYDGTVIIEYVSRCSGSSTISS